MKLYKIGEKNKIVIPTKVCKELKLKKGDLIECYCYEDLIILRKPHKKNKINFKDLPDLHKFIYFKELYGNISKRGGLIDNIPSKIVESLAKK